MKKNYITGRIDSNTGKICKVSTTWNIRDYLGAIMVRFAFNRNDYRVDPGLYAVGTPANGSNVFVSANYKLSFDILRKSLTGMDAWILVLDTKGINVWCSAGKGTFGTDELVHRVSDTLLGKIINHKKLVLPQLSATGVSAHEVKKRSGFSVIYGPVRAMDIKEFLNSNMKATTQMRRVNFTLLDRLVLTPTEIVTSAKYALVTMLVFFFASGIHKGGYSIHIARITGFGTIKNLLAGYLAGTFLGPVLLPWLPGRSFSFKGFIIGLIIVILIVFTRNQLNISLETIAWFFIIPSISSFLTLNFTGASTYTSLSGVKKELKIAVPLQVSGCLVGMVLWVVSKLTGVSAG